MIQTLTRKRAPARWFDSSVVDSRHSDVESGRQTSLLTRNGVEKLDPPFSDRMIKDDVARSVAENDSLS